jgi:hypothetical protein
MIQLQTTVTMISFLFPSLNLIQNPKSKIQNQNPNQNLICLIYLLSTLLTDDMKTRYHSYLATLRLQLYLRRAHLPIPYTRALILLSAPSSCRLPTSTQLPSSTDTSSYYESSFTPVRLHHLISSINTSRSHKFPFCQFTSNHTFTLSPSQHRRYSRADRNKPLPYYLHHHFGFISFSSFGIVTIISFTSHFGYTFNYRYTSTVPSGSTFLIPLTIYHFTDCNINLYHHPRCVHISRYTVLLSTFAATPA